MNSQEFPVHRHGPLRSWVHGKILGQLHWLNQCTKQRQDIDPNILIIRVLLGTLRLAKTLNRTQWRPPSRLTEVHLGVEPDCERQLLKTPNILGQQASIKNTLK
jgi:hypothetical protein